MKKRVLLPLIAVGVILLLLASEAGMRLLGERKQRFTPAYDRVELSALLADGLSEEDYRTLFYQTGLGRRAVDEVIGGSDDPAAALRAYQDAFFAQRRVACRREVLITFIEDTVDENGNPEETVLLAPYKPGYVLVMLSTHTLCFRHGHAGLITGNNRVLEAPMLGTDSGDYSLSDWLTSPTLAVLRLKDTDDETLAAIAREARQNLRGLPYRLTSGLIRKDNGTVTPPSTHCAHIVWYAFRNAGLDVDRNGGNIVTVQDLLYSPAFEVVQIVGMDPALFLP